MAQQCCPRLKPRNITSKRENFTPQQQTKQLIILKLLHKDTNKA